MEGVEIKLSCLKDHLKNSTENYSNDNGVWRVVGQEQDGSLLLTWTSSVVNGNSITIIGIFDVTNAHNEFKVLLEFNDVKNIIQASVNTARTILVFVTKEKDVMNCDVEGSDSSFKSVWFYEVFLKCTNTSQIIQVDGKKTRQTMAQFLYRKKGSSPDRFLILTHQDSIQLYQIEETEPLCETSLNDDCISDGYDNDNDNDVAQQSAIKEVPMETVVKAFCWAQWDAIHQSLYYIHYRKPPPVAVEGEVQDDTELAPTLSALQFHDDMPHETVLNIPLNLPGMVGDESLLEDEMYEDDPVPLRVHDQSLDVVVVSDSKGILCVCHYYLYQPVQPPASDMLCESQTVHFAYSVTLLHHGRVVHFDMPGVPFSQASVLRPTFTMQGDHHLLVYMPGLFVHLLDIGPNHEPCCHIVLSDKRDLMSLTALSSLRLVKLLTEMPSFYSAQMSTDNLLLNMTTLDVVTLHVAPQHLITAYNSEDAVLENKLSILHYFLIHIADPTILGELIIPLAKNCMDLSVPKLMQEVLVGSAYASTVKGLPSDAIPLLDLLPLTTLNPNTVIQIKVSTTTRLSMSLKQEDLWNPSVMLLSPRQRLMPYRADMWTALWDVLSTPRESRFRPATVAEKLMVSLVCYQPEALSRCSTPLSPGGPLGSGGTLSDLAMITGSRAKQITDPLPFYEVESSAASKQEHVISVNLREVSMHLLKRGKGVISPMQVHAVATRYAAAQLESSYQLCHHVSKSSAVDTHHQERGFPLIDNLEDGKRCILFALMERYNLAVETLAFPLPQGFPSFISYLGYRTLPFSMFLQYVNASVLQLQVDVMKAIMADLPDSGDGLTRKLRLLQILPRSRGKRLLNQWSHPASLMIRAREHALNILSGVEGAHARGHPHRLRNQTINRGLAAFPSGDRLSPLDTFLDLLTAKASLAELDFTLLIEATMASTEDFME